MFVLLFVLSNPRVFRYGSGDTRYMRFHPETHATETLLAISGPLELWAAYMLATGQRYKTAMVVAALTHWGFFWANTSVIYIAEIYAGYQWVADGWVGCDVPSSFFC